MELPSTPIVSPMSTSDEGVRSVACPCSSSLLHFDITTCSSSSSFLCSRPTSCRISSGARSLTCLSINPSVPSAESASTIEDLKDSLKEALAGVNRGIFGLPARRKAEIEQLIESLEKRNPVPRPTEQLEKVKGDWKLLYSTISILGSKRTKLGLREFITPGDFLQSIDVDKSKAVNTVTFSVAGLGMFSGSFAIEASFSPSSETRVDIRFEKSSISPEQLLRLFQKNYDLLLSIFNPEGWLEITYVDDTMRVGRDDKGNVFLLERLENPVK